MKPGKSLSILSAALLGLSAAVFPPAAPDASVGIVAEAANEQPFTYGDFEYSYVPGSIYATVTKYSGPNTDIAISGYVPSPDGWKIVSKIGSYLDRKISVAPGNIYPDTVLLSTITSVNIPSTVTEICDSAFKGCDTLQSVVFSSNLQRIGISAFENCDQLTQVSLPASLQTIAAYAFENCDNLYSVSLTGAATIGYRAFGGCRSLYRISLTNNCRADADAFSGCTNLMRINNAVPWNVYAYQSTHAEPRLTPSLHQILINCFLGATDVRFVKDYCNALCDYVVKTETTCGSDHDWMSDAVKARQLHDWLVRHAAYEDNRDQNGVQNEAIGDPENQSAEGLCLSYGLNIRGAGVGETVCEGFSKAYTALLTQAGIEAYTLRASLTPFGRTIYDYGHAWNLVKVDGAYYQVDVTWDDGISTDTAISYQYFLKSNDTMTALHSQNRQALFNTPSFSDTGLTVPQQRALLNSCSADFADANQDGILDGNYDFSASVTSYDNSYKSAIAPYFNNGFVLTNDSLGVFLDYLHLAKLSPNDILIRLLNGQHII